MESELLLIGLAIVVGVFAFLTAVVKLITAMVELLKNNKTK